MDGVKIIEAALSARTLDDANALQKMIIKHVGAEYQRPLGENWNNSGMIRLGGSYDHKIIENVTNMQDAVLERLAISKYGNRKKVPFKSPREAADELVVGEKVPWGTTVEFYESDPPANRSKRISMVFRDEGCGMTTAQVPHTIFALGSRNKEDIGWLQGAFGLGGKTTFFNAKAVILVTRRAPEMLEEGESDSITVALLMWQPTSKLEAIYYLVTKPWEENPLSWDAALPLHVGAKEYPAFSPGTHLALISYGVEGLYRARSGGDDRTFEAIFNTRLYDPVLPVSFSNKLLAAREGRIDILKGLNRRLIDNPRAERRQGKELLPFNIHGKTYQLPVSYYVFSKPGDSGARRNFVAHDHAVIFTSNGQVHYHWSPSEFRWKTKHSKLSDRIFIIVETDALPIQVRSSFFGADRSQLIRREDAIKLEEAVVGFIDNWEDLQRINGELIKEALLAGPNDRPTINIARQISRALTMKGFSLGSMGGNHGGGTYPPGPRPKGIDLHDDPTYMKAPGHIQAVLDKTKFLTYTIDAKDGFIPERASLTIHCDHPEINDREITVGELKAGHVRVSIAIPSEIALGTYKIDATLDGWLKHAGGMGETLHATTEMELVDEIKPGTNAGNRNGASGPSEGALVALRWMNTESVEGWTPNTVGEVVMVPARTLAEIEEYAELITMGDKEIPTLQLNREYSPLKKYIHARMAKISNSGIDNTRDRYAVGVGVGLCILYLEMEKQKKKSAPVDEMWMNRSGEACARSVISMMPEFDKLMKEAGVEDL